MPSEHDTASERLIASWRDRPFTGHRRRRWVVEHRIIAEQLAPGVGVDIRHEVRCPPHPDTDGWTVAEVYEFRDRGIVKVSADDWWWSS